MTWKSAIVTGQKVSVLFDCAFKLTDKYYAFNPWVNSRVPQRGCDCRIFHGANAMLGCPVLRLTMVQTVEGSTA